MPFAAVRLKSGSTTKNSPLERNLSRIVSAAAFATGEAPKSSTLNIGRWMGCAGAFAATNAINHAMNKQRRIAFQEIKCLRPALRFVYDHRRDYRAHTLPFLLQQGNTRGGARKHA